MKRAYYLIFLISISYGCILSEEGALENALLASQDSISFDITHFHMPHTTIRAIKVVSEQEVYFAGSNGKWGYTKDGGNHWHIDSIASYEFRSIEVTPNRNIFLVSVQSPTQILLSTNSGKTFKPCLTLSDSQFIDQVFFSNNSNGVAIADPVAGRFPIYTTHNGGHSWEITPTEQLPIALEEEYPFAASNSVITASHQEIWFGTGGASGARVHYSPDYGQHWQVTTTPLIANAQMTGIFALHMFSSKVGMVCGGDWDSLSLGVSNLAITKDGGSTWTPLTAINHAGYLSDFAFIPGHNHQQILALKGSAKMQEASAYFSGDLGHSWRQYPNRKNYITIRFASKNVAWLGGKNHLGRLEIHS